MKSTRITRQWKQLSAYLDGQLPQRQAARLEKRLSSDARLRAEYEDLKRTRSLLRSLPKRRVPRNFTLTPDMVRAPRRKFSFIVPALRLSSSAAALLLVLTFAVELVGGLSPRLAMTADEAAYAPVMEMAVEATVTVEETEEEPMILLWNAQPGIGGGMDQPAEGLGGGPVSEPPPEAALAEELPMAEALPMEETPAVEAPAPSAEDTAPREMEAAGEPQTEMELEAPASAAEEAPQAALRVLTPTAAPSPAIAAEEAPAEKALPESETVILGIAPEEEQGQIQATDTQPAPVRAEQRGDLTSCRWLQIGLGAFAVVALLVSFLIPRKRA